MGDIILPKFYTPSTGSGSAISCSLVMIDQYNPINYTPSGDKTQLCQHLAGIDAAFGILDAAFADINATSITVDSISPINYTPLTTSLPAFLSAIDVRFGQVNVPLPRDFGTQLFNIDIGNISAPGLTLALDNTVHHNLVGDSLKATSTSTADKTITQTTNLISFIGGREYELSEYIYVPLTNFPNGAVVSMTVVAGTGKILPTKKLIVGDPTSGKWNKVSTRFFPDTDQVCEIQTSITGFTNAKILNIDDPMVAIVPGTRTGAIAPYSIVSLTNLTALYNRIATAFVSTGGTMTINGGNLNVTIHAAEYVINGRVFWRNDEVVVMTATKDNYIFYNSFNDNYVIKPVTISTAAPLADEGEIVIGFVTTTGSGSSSSVDQRILAPYNGTHIQDNSISTTQIINAAVTDAKMSNTGVGAGSYIFSNITVSAKGRITAASSPVILTSPYLFNLLVYNGTNFVNTPNLTLSVNATTLGDNSTLDSALMTLRAYYDSDDSATITAVPYDAVMQHVMTDRTPASKLIFTIGGTTFLKYTSKGVLELLNASSTPSLISGGNVMYSANETLHSITKSVLHVKNEFGHVIKLMTANTYALTYNTPAFTLNAYTPDTESSAYTGIDNAQGGTPYAKLTDVNALRTAYENLRTSYDNLIGIVVAMNVDLKTLGFTG